MARFMVRSFVTFAVTDYPVRAADSGRSAASINLTIPAVLVEFQRLLRTRSLSIFLSLSLSVSPRGSRSRSRPYQHSVLLVPGQTWPPGD